MTIKLTKSELRLQQEKCAQLEKYLPTLKLKKMLLQAEINGAHAEIEALGAAFTKRHEAVESYVALFTDKGSYDLFPSLKVKEIKKIYENIAGVEVAIFKEAVFAEQSYALYNSPAWLDSAILDLQKLISLKEETLVLKEKKQALEKECREVSIRVNLFEKILIPRAKENIKKIKIFLGDQQLSAVCQAKVAKQKIVNRASL